MMKGLGYVVLVYFILMSLSSCSLREKITYRLRTIHGKREANMMNKTVYQKIRTCDIDTSKVYIIYQFSEILVYFEKESVMKVLNESLPANIGITDSCYMILSNLQKSVIGNNIGICTINEPVFNTENIDDRWACIWNVTYNVIDKLLDSASVCIWNTKTNKWAESYEKKVCYVELYGSGEARYASKYCLGQNTFFDVSIR